ncbi:PolC-type DNA polymerase III [Acinetobacter pittii]|uniref:3'-5' exonuclease n=1 Tax=Acinetobacter pittii TaxID=48296 RepID=UPI00083F7D3A|nr:3'-5' exonuclease [Acinetobacter pittii]ODL98062.1 DNA polymerase III subunit epsilon [Acinetobacter pittii]
MNVSPIIVLDFETTGVSPETGDRITEVAALRIVEGEITERFVSLINCGVNIPYYITKLTGITQDMVNHAPLVKEVIPSLLDFIGTDPLLAHNAGFDEKFLKAESIRQELTPSHNGLICSLKLARRILPHQPSYRLGAMADLFNIKFNGTAHRAEADAEVTAQLFNYLCTNICHTYGFNSIDQDLLLAINKLTISRVPKYLKNIAAQSLILK